MQCPYCADDGNRVIDSRLARDGSEIRRRRECDECGRRFTTRERVEETLPRIIKSDSRREEYDRHKLLRGIEHACVKRPVSAEAVERLVLRELGGCESSESLGIFEVQQRCGDEPSMYRWPAVSDIMLSYSEVRHSGALRA